MAMVSPTPRPSLRNAASCRVAVANGGLGGRLRMSRSTATARNRASPMRRAAFRATASSEIPVSPIASPSSRTSVAAKEKPSAAAASASTGPGVPRHEALDLGLALADQAQSHRLHPARRTAAGQLAPQHRRQAVADQVVERAPRLPRLDQVHVDRAGVVQRRPDRLLRHLVERDAMDRPVAERAPLVQPVQHLPGDRLALPVRVGGEHQPVGALQRPGDRAERPGGPAPGLVDHRKSVPGIDRARLRRQVADMAAGRHHPVCRAEPGPDRLRFGRRFDDHHMPGAAVRVPAAALQSPPPAPGHGPAFRAADPPAAFAGPRMGPRRLAA